MSLFSGGNSLSQTVKNGRLRPILSPNDVKNDIHSTAEYLHEFWIIVFVLGIPRRHNFSFASICCLNELSCRDTYRYRYVGLASNMSCDNVLRADGVHLISFGPNQLKTVFNKKVYGFLRNENWFNTVIVLSRLRWCFAYLLKWIESCVEAIAFPYLLSTIWFVLDVSGLVLFLPHLYIEIQQSLIPFSAIMICVVLLSEKLTFSYWKFRNNILQLWLICLETVSISFELKI